MSSILTSIKHCTRVIAGISILFSVCCLASCNNRNNTSKELKTDAPVTAFDPEKEITNDSMITHHPAVTREDSLLAEHEIDSTNYLLVFKNKTNIWLDTSLGRPHSTWSDFHILEYSDKIIHAPSPGTPEKQFLTDYDMFLKWSPDSSYIFDIGSYGVTMAKDESGKLYVESEDVDSEIDLYNNKAKTKQRILFFGPSTCAWDAHWMDTSHVAMLGLCNPNADVHPDTILWIINIKNSFISKYKFSHSQ